MIKELNVEAPTEEQIKKLKLTMHYVKKYSDYESGIDRLNMLLDRRIRPNNCLDDPGQVTVINIMRTYGWEVDPILPEISNKYVNLLEEVLSKCPFSKEQAKQFAEEALTRNKNITKRKSIWEWICG